MITKNMEKVAAFVFLALAQGVNAEDDFNYRRTEGRDYGPADWDEVSCNNLKTCPGWPDKHLGSVGRFSLKDWPNNCGWCPIEGNNCGQHRQSPIDLQRDRADPNSPNWKECEDWHWMQFKDGTCDWEDVEDQFVITRHGLQHKIPVKSNGDIGCKANNGERRWPKLDYSKGFQDWWFLSQTELSVPSEHVQHGKRYAAEVVLSHFYEFKHAWNHVGKVAVFLQDYEGEAPWHFLDKLICRWRREEEKVRSKCNLPPAPVYKMCELYRGQTRSAEDFESPTEQVTYPTFTPLVPPKAIPIYNFGGTPPEEAKPLQLCQGDCDFPTDCAKGLICHRRDAYEAVPGCIGGEQDFTNTDYCVFDAYGEGYSRPTDTPTQHPTITQRPTLTLMDPKPLQSFGSTPPDDKFPLQICQGDCDFDDHCGKGLICFQRNESMPVPGCIGDDPTKTDFCILDPYGDGSYTFPPTGVPSRNPSQAPFVRPTGQAKVIANLGWEPPTPIGECKGDCDDDSDCDLNMICFQRNRQFEPVPSCIGGEQDPTLTDYCIYKTPEPTQQPIGAPTSSPTDTPTAVPTVPVPTQTPSISPTTPAPTLGPFQRGTIKFLGWKPAKPILDLCEGDCDRDEDCANGLLCFDRKKVTDQVPGCDKNGGGFEEGMSDYCYDPRVYDTSLPTGSPTKPKATEDPTKEPSVAPVITTAEPTNPSPSASPSASPTEAPVTDKPTVDPIKRLCLVHPQCQLQGLEGFCCPTTTGQYLACCDIPLNPPSNAPVAPPSENPTKNPTNRPTEAPVAVPTDTPVAPPTTGETGQNEQSVLEFIGWSPTEDQSPLKVCQGDCDINQDCGPGLKCYQRYNAYDPVPGCAGGEADDSLADYCVAIDATFDSVPAETGAPTSSPIEATKQPSAGPTKTPTKLPTENPTKAPTKKPTGSPTEEPVKQDNPVFPMTMNCRAQKYRDLGINFNRMCKPDSCCSIPRKSGGFCERMYTALGDEVEAACYHCCAEAASAGYPKEVGPAAEENPKIPKKIECDQVDEAYRICRPNSCCDGGERSSFCRSQLALYPRKMESICWYCCYPSYETDFGNRRLSAGETGLEDIEHREGDRTSYDDMGRRVLLREENFGEPHGTEEEQQKYFDEIYSAHQRREEEVPIVENYDDIFWWPYEWLLKVGSEYYFRYEGTQTTPPCINKAHWRILKDPIRVAPHQIKELERLIAWRINDQCQADTAGKPRGDGNLDAVDVARPLQSYHELHRMVFCECQDWPSKFPQERSWCRNWKNRDPNIRFEDNPYNWRQAGF